MTFLSISTITESNGAFFGVGWLLLAPLLLYLQVVNRARSQEVEEVGMKESPGQAPSRSRNIVWASAHGTGSGESTYLNLVAQRPSFKILGVRIDAVQTRDAVAQMDRWIQERTGCHFIAVTGMHGVMEAQEDPHFKQILNTADLVAPDGISMVWLGRYRHRHPLQRRATGSDIMEMFCKETGAKYRHFLYGGAPGVGEKLARALQQQYGVQLAGIYVPPFRPLTPQEDAGVIEMVNAAQPDVLWVGLSTPKQERWMFEHRAALRVPVMLGVGAAFDFLAGTKGRAPQWMGGRGLEWLFRFLSEPRRLWRRVLIKVPRFILYVALESLHLKNFDAPG